MAYDSYESKLTFASLLTLSTVTNLSASTMLNITEYYTNATREGIHNI